MKLPRGFFFILTYIVIVAFDYLLFIPVLNHRFSRCPSMDKATYLISCHWSVSIPPENSSKPEV